MSTHTWALTLTSQYIAHVRYIREYTRAGLLFLRRDLGAVLLIRMREVC